MSTHAFWITAKGKIKKPQSRHILSIVKQPIDFGETDKSIDATFEKYGENKMSNVEGKAREEVMLRVIRRGHIRIRINGTRNSQHWSIQVQQLTNKTEEHIWFWANTAIKDGTVNDRYADVVVHELGRNDKMTKTTIDKIASGGSIKECVTPFGNKRLYDSRIYTDADALEPWIDYADTLEPDAIHENAKVQILASKMIKLEG